MSDSEKITIEQTTTNVDEALLLVFDWKGINSSTKINDQKFSEARKMIQVMLEETQDVEYEDLRRSFDRLLTVRHYQMTQEEFNIQSQHKFMFHFFFGTFEDRSTRQMEGFCYDLRTLQHEGFLKMNQSSPTLPIPLSVKRWNFLIRKYGNSILAKYTNTTGYLMYPLSRNEALFIFQKINSTPVICGSSQSFGCWGGNINNLIIKYRATLKEFFDKSPTERYAYVDFKKKTEQTKVVLDEKSVVSFLEKQKKSLESNPQHPALVAVIGLKDKTQVTESVSLEINDDNQKQNASQTRSVSDTKVVELTQQDADILVAAAPLKTSLREEDNPEPQLNNSAGAPESDSNQANASTEMTEASIGNGPSSPEDPLKYVRVSQITPKPEVVVENVKLKLRHIEFLNETIEIDLNSNSTRDFIIDQQKQAVSDEAITSILVTHYIVSNLQPYIKQQ